VGHFERKFHTEGGIAHQSTTVGVRKLEWLPVRVVSKYPQCIAWFCHKAGVWQTELSRRMDGRTELQLPRPR